jgi:CheY-like chemotaxis protein
MCLPGAPGIVGVVFLRAVVVEDSAEFLRAARSLLEREGIIVAASASTGAEALRRVAEHHPDIVLVDVRLGDESGFDVAERLGRHTPVILISAHPEQDFADLIDASPAIGFLPKSRLSGRAIVELLATALPGT